MQQKSILHKLFHVFSQRPLLFALLSGFFFRTIASFYNYAPLSLDDYTEIMDPALRKLFEGQSISVSIIRMEIFPQIFYVFVKLAHLSGIVLPSSLVSSGLFMLGMISLFSIAGIYFLSLNFMDKKWSGIAAMLVSLYFLMPFISSRAELNSFVMSSIPWGFYFLTKKNSNRKDIFLGSYFLSLSVILRYQIGILIATTSLYFLYQTFMGKWKKENWIYFLSAGIAVLLVMGALDIVDNRSPFSTLWNYISTNYQSNIVHTKYGKAPWSVYLVLFLCLLIPPFSFLLTVPLPRVFKRIPLLSINFLIYVIFHSLIANKQERFMFPVIPLFFFFSVYGIQMYWNKKWIRVSFYGFLILNSFLIFPATFTRGQMNVINAAQYLSDKEKKPLYLLDVDFWFHAYTKFAFPYPVQTWKISGLISALKTSSANSLRILKLGQITDDDVKMLDEIQLKCEQISEFHPDLMEKLVILTNPLYNKRRDTTYLYDCQRVQRREQK
ncbi:MAG: hypothetical protein OEV66_05130 [Spirochaetia bacterium]|nr:hypothetical protein [Spirochaetia bacterium]